MPGSLSKLQEHLPEPSIKNALLAVGTYGLLFWFQVSAKIFSGLRQAKYMRDSLSDVPMADMSLHPRLGSIPDVAKNRHRRHEYLIDAMQWKPLTWSYGLIFDPHFIELYPLDPAIVKHVLKDNSSNYTKPPSKRDFIWKYMREFLGNGIFAARHGPDAEDGGREWTRQRKVAASIFTRSNFNTNMSEVFVQKAQHFCDLLEAPAKEGKPVDLQLNFFSYTMDSVMKIFFGEESDTLGGQDNAYATAFDSAHRNLVKYMTTNFSFLTLQNIIPWPFGTNFGLFQWIKTLRDPFYSGFREANAILNRESLRVVRDARTDPKLAERRDLLALFLQAEAQEQEGFGDKWLRDVVLNFILAGRDTTACTLSWLFYVLATHPEIQAKVCKEIDERLPANKDINFKAVGPAELPYLHAVLYEVLRLYPPVPQNNKKAVADDVLPDGTKVFKHTKVWYLPYAMGRDPQRYPDPLVVKPERWIPFKEPLPHEFPVFQAGPRICLGMNMAVFETKIVAGILLRNYTFSISPEEAEKITPNPFVLTMSVCNSKTHDSHNLWLTPKRRTGTQ